MIFRDQEKEIEALDYYLRKEEVEHDIQKVFSALREMTPSGVWLEQIILQEICFERIFFSEVGIAVFCKYEKELTDPLLWKDLKRAYDVFISCLEGVEGDNLAFYCVLNSPISQKALCGLFNPKIEFLTPIIDLEKTFWVELEQRPKVFSEEQLITFMACFEAVMDGKSTNEDIFSDETGEYIRIRGKWKRRSQIDSERYFKFTLFSGMFGIHKVYANCYMEFVIYLFTLGFLGVGWMFDLAEICLGVSKDKNKAYIGPFINKKKKVIYSVAAAVVYILIFTLILY